MIGAGTRLGVYEILAPLGAGGMGEVYRARDGKLGREIAIKVLPPRLASDADALSRFEREAKAVAALSHPNILPYVPYFPRLQSNVNCWTFGLLRGSLSLRGLPAFEHPGHYRSRQRPPLCVLIPRCP